MPETHTKSTKTGHNHVKIIAYECNTCGALIKDGDTCCPPIYDTYEATQCLDCQAIWCYPENACTCQPS